jgi:uncharacterized protein (DUF2336 family)
VQNKAQFDDRIRNLLSLAQDNSVESRTLLFSHICDIFLQNRPLKSENQIRMLTEIINELVSDVDIEIRKELCHVLMDMEQPPAVLVKLISEDIIEVSGKLLEHAFIPEEQLLYLIKYGSDDHRDCIGRRFGLSPLIRTALENETKKSVSSSKKMSLKDLKEAEEESNELTEDVTANILELLRNSKNEKSTRISFIEAEGIDFNECNFVKLLIYG